MACRLKMKGLGLWQAATLAGKHTFKWTPDKVQQMRNHLQTLRTKKSSEDPQIPIHILQMLKHLEFQTGNSHVGKNKGKMDQVNEGQHHHGHHHELQ